MEKPSDLETEKLRLEIKGLEAKTSIFGRLAPMVSILLAVGAFCFGTYQYFQDRAEARASQERALAQEYRLRERELFKPLWELKIATYFEASSAAAIIATAPEGEKRTLAIEKFWELYEGPLIVFENDDIARRMVAFGKCLSGREECDRKKMAARSRALATQVQVSIGTSWDEGLGGFAEGKAKYE